MPPTGPAPAPPYAGYAPPGPYGAYPPHGGYSPYGFPPPRWIGDPCPKCQEQAGETVAFTWWGGFIGPKLLNHRKCRACGYEFNARTGKPNTTGIILYWAFGLAAFLVLILGFWLLNRQYFR